MKLNLPPASPSIESLLCRIADALDRAYLKTESHPSVTELFGDPKVDPVDYIMETWGETREDAEKIVATTKPQEDGVIEWPGPPACDTLRKLN